jgi:uncharacterized protein YkwD
MKILKVLAIFCLLIVCFSCSEDNPVVVPDDTELSLQSLLDEINLVRTNPKQYAQILKSIRQYYNGNLYQEPGEITMVTNEGVNAVNEAINELESISSRSALSLSPGLNKAAKAHADDIGPKGLTQHNSSDGTTFGIRIKKYVETDGNIAENISFGSLKTARKIMIQLIVDDGVPSRGHRVNILNANYKYVGFGWGSHSVYKNMCVMNFANIVYE